MLESPGVTAGSLIGFRKNLRFRSIPLVHPAISCDDNENAAYIWLQVKREKGQKYAVMSDCRWFKFVLSEDTLDPGTNHDRGEYSRVRFQLEKGNKGQPPAVDLTEFTYGLLRRLT